MYRLLAGFLAVLALPAWAQSVSPISLNFGPVTTGNSATQSVTVSNSSASSISINGMGVSGTAFGMSGMMGVPGICQLGPLAANSSCTLPITFIPAVVGPLTSTLTITFGSGSTAMVALAGTGVAPTTGGGTVSAQLAPTSVDFGPVILGNTQMETVMLSVPAGSTSMAVEGFSVSGADYRVLGCVLAPLPSGSSCGVEVFFSPTQAGEADGTLTVLVAPAGKGVAATALTVPLKGTGIAAQAAGPDFTLTVGTPAKTIGVSSTTLTIIPVNQFSGTAVFNCLNLPAGASCSFSPSTADLAAGMTTVQVTINPPASATLMGRRVGLFSTLAFAGLLLPFSRRRRRSIFLVAGLIALCLLGRACSGSMPGSFTSKSFGSSNFQVVISATAGTKQHVVLVTAGS